MIAAAPFENADLQTRLRQPAGADGAAEAGADHYRFVAGFHLNLRKDRTLTLPLVRESDAASLGFHPKERDYSVRINTANGVGRAAQVELGMVEVGDIVVRDVPALIVPDNVLNVNLLGMTFLSRVRLAHERGRLTMEQ